MPELTNAAAQAPATAPAPAAPSTEVAPDTTAFTAPTLEPAFFAAKLAAFRSATAAPAAEAPAASETPAVAEPVVSEPPAAPASPEPAQAPQTPVAETPVAYLERMAKVENERDSLAARLKELEPKASTAEQVEAALAKDPIQFLLDRGVTHEALQDFLINGPRKIDPALAQAQKDAAEVKAKLEAREAADMQAQAAQNVAAFKQREVVPHVTEAAYPLLHALHAEQSAEIVYNVMNAHYQRGENVSAAQAAAMVEGELAAIHAKLAAKAAPKPAAAPPAPVVQKQRPAARELTNEPGFVGSSAEPVADIDDGARFQRALDLMQRRLGTK